MIGKDEMSVKAWAKSKGYVSQTSQLSDLLEFRLFTRLGDKDLSIGIKIIKRMQFHGVNI